MQYIDQNWQYEDIYNVTKIIFQLNASVWTFYFSKNTEKIVTVST